jgi:hypothetical protein
MEQLISIALRIDRQVLRYRTVLNLVGWTCFVVVTADYAGFINLPPFLTIPFWFGVILNIFRWGIWEAMVQPQIQVRAERDRSRDMISPDQRESR